MLWLVAAYLFAEGAPDPAEFTGADSLMMAWLVAVLVGLVAMWRWPNVGGVVSLVGAVGLFATNFLLTGRPPSGWELPVFLFTPGVLCLVAWWIDRNRRDTPGVST